MPKRVFRSIAVLVLAALAVWAQTETGQITGTVTDPTGAVIPNAKVTLKSSATGLERSTVANPAGIYTFTGLLPGRYTITVANPGFASQGKEAALAIGARIGMDFQLVVSQSATTVEVSSETPVFVNTETQTLGTVITQRQVTELPTLTRNPYALILTAPNVSDQDPAAQNNQVGQGAGAAINGQRASSTNVLLDGASNNDEYAGQVGEKVPLDSVAEFSILTSDFTAEFGRAGGGIINVATKSGTNAFHGTAYEFNRVSALGSNSFDNNANGTAKPIFARNQFGYSIGGPVKKDKLFFFNNVEWIRVRSSAPRVVFSPTSDFIAAAAPATQAFFNAYGQLRPNARVLQTLTKSDLVAQGFNPCAGAAAGGLCNSLSATTPMFNQVTYNRPFDAGGGSPENTYLVVGRVDYNLSDKTIIYGRYALEHEADQAGSLVDSPYQGYDTGATTHNNNFLLSAIHTFSPTFSEQSKVVFNRLNLSQPLGEKPPSPTLYVLPTAATAMLGNLVAMPGYNFDNPGNAIPFGGPQNFLQFYQDQTWTHGSHAVRFGGSYVYLRDNRTFGAYSNAVAALGARFGQGMDNFLAGQLYQFQAAIDPQGKFPCAGTPTADCTVSLPVGSPNFSRSNRYHEFALYAQDSWRIRPRVTLSLGLRWEYFGVQHNKDSNLDANFYEGTGATFAEQIRNGAVSTVPNSPIGGLWAKDFDNFAPRVGIAWDMFGNGRTSLRGGYGIGYERNFGNVTFNVIQNPPNYAVIALTAPADLSVIPIPVSNAGPLAGSSGSKALPAVSLRNVDSNIQTAYAHFWSASLEHQFSNTLFAALSYSGSKGVDLYSLENPNRIGAGNLYLGDPCTPGTSPADPGTCTARLRTTQYTNINRRGNNGFSNYNAFVTRVNVQNIHNSGLNLNANYTWSHAIDNLSSVFSVSQNNFNLGLLDPFNPNLDKGDAEFDVRHRVAISAIWDIPVQRNGHGIAKQVFGGWTLAPIFTASTGAPFTLFDSTNAFQIVPRAMFNGPVANNGSGNLTPAGPPNDFVWIGWPASAVDHSYVNPKLNISDFGPFPANMTGRSAFRGPGQWHLDVGVYKNFKLTERATFQLRGEAYNIMNHSNLFLVGADNDVASISFADVKRGVPAYGAFEHRDLQLAAKLIF